MIVGLVDNEYPSGSSMSASVIICIVLLGLIPKLNFLEDCFGIQIQLCRTSLAEPSDGSSVAKRVIQKKI